MAAYRSKLITICIIHTALLFFTGCNNGAGANAATGGSLTMVVDGVTVKYQAIPSTCSWSVGFSCSFSSSGSAADYPQVRIFFNRSLAAGTSFTTASSSVFFGDSLTYYENSCQRNAGGGYYSYDTNGTVQMSISEYSDTAVSTDIKFSFSGAVYRVTPAYSKSITSGSVNLHVCNGGSGCGDSTGQATTSAVASANTINRNQLYPGISISQKESKCYVFTPPIAQTYTLTISSAVTVNSLSFNYGYSASSGSFSGGSCGTAGNGTCSLVISNGGFPTSLEVMAGNNLAGSFSMQITP